ncbi:uncharacterized protein LOC128854313 isoform X2 [Cuculus canorus]|uniref:uncharacterized protein LOC128854313 isoform X2 n=1 Tax=Cuculus canorus TaxID=55661 RepID=UPI0023AAE5BB|nr:uncharacterized protein LOC128854313 isoform X2 [Cuculus canorus]
MALEAGVVPADLLQELLGQRLPDHRGGNSPTMSPHRGGSGGLRCPRTRLSAVPAGLWVPRAQLVLGATQAWLSLSVHPGFQLGTVLWLRLENSSEEDGDSNSALESRQAGGSPALRGCPQRRSWAGWVPRGFGKSRAVVSGQWQSNSGKVTPLRLCWKDWRHWRLTSASSAPSWALRSCCGAVGSWSCCRSSKACASGCRNARGAGTASTAPSCQGKRRMKVGARERALQDASGWSLPSSQPRAQAAAWGQRLRECQRNGEQEPAGKQLWRSLCLLCCPGQVTASPCPGPPPVLTVP